MGIVARRYQRVGDGFVVGATIPDPVKNVGVYAHVARSAYTGSTTISTNGTVIRDKNITQYIEVDASDVSFINCYFSAGGDNSVNGGMVNCKTAACSNIRFYRCTFIPSVPSYRRDAVYGHHYTVERCHIERTVDGCAVANQYSANVDVRIIGNWIGNLSWYENDGGAHADGTHNDGVQIHSGSNIDIIGNAFDGYKWNALGTPALDGSANNLHPQIGQIILSQHTAYYHVANLRVNQNFIWGGDNGLKFRSLCAIHGDTLGYDVECLNNIWMDDNQRDYGNTWKYYPIRTDSQMTINGLGPFPTTGATYDVNGNTWSATSPEVLTHQGDAVFIRCDAA